MRTLEFSRFALTICAAAAILSACSGGSPVPIAGDHALNGASGPKNHQTFSYTGSEQTFIVPPGVKRLTVVARGGEAGGYLAGFPGRVYAIIPVRAGDKLYIFVGGSGTSGGFNGGGTGGTVGYGTWEISGGGGGGASDVRMGGHTLKDRIIVAAGGGGSGESYSNYDWTAGGKGGGLVGQAGGSIGYQNTGGGGGGGTQSQGGSGGAGGLGDQSNGNGQPGVNGALGLGGNGGNGGPGPYCHGSSGYCYGMPGGGGGGGYYGGGGGGGGAAGYHFGSYFGNQSGGGGGGSSYVEPRAITSRMWTGWRGTGDGRVIFSWK